MSNPVRVRCVLCTTWWSVTPDQLGAALRCEKCGASFSADKQVKGPERLPVMPVVRSMPHWAPPSARAQPPLLAPWVPAAMSLAQPAARAMSATGA
ncbi:MAG: putative Zn finger-like uncharacterized protein [Myxococcota bacterium]|jgi:predicted Zn finger-like uncharacterized protein